MTAHTLVTVQLLVPLAPAVSEVVTAAAPTSPTAGPQPWCWQIRASLSGVGSLQRVRSAAPGAPASRGIAHTVLWGCPGCWAPLCQLCPARAPGKGLVRRRGGRGPPWD